MASSVVFFFCFFLGLSLHVSASKDACPVRFCGPRGPEIRFPFRVSDSQPERCGYPGFDISCNVRGQAILQLPGSQDFVVDFIDYEKQHIVLKDPDDCLASRLRNLTFSSSVFSAQEYGNLSFAYCSDDVVIVDFPYGVEEVRCLSGPNNTVMVVAGSFDYYFSFLPCRTETVSVPVAPQYPTDITEIVVLKWDRPDCRSCEKSGRRCGFKGSAGSHIKCFGKHGLSKWAKLKILLGVTLPFLLCMSGLTSYLILRARVPRNRDPPDQPPTGNNGGNSVANITSLSSTSREGRRATNGIAGVNLVTVESNPTIEVNDNGELLTLNDIACVICSSEYQPGETLRRIPYCGHYFHVRCIDEWLERLELLQRNGSCPICRNTRGLRTR